MAVEEVDLWRGGRARLWRHAELAYVYTHTRKHAWLHADPIIKGGRWTYQHVTGRRDPKLDMCFTEKATHAWHRQGTQTT